MVCTINKLKSLLWYMVLATVAVLTWGPQTMGKMIAASQHNAREKRQLRPRSEETNGGDEERMHSFDLNLPALPESIEGFGETIPMGQLGLGENQEAAKISNLLAENDVISKLAAAKNDPATESIIDDLKIALLRKWTSENSDKDVFNLLLANKVDVTEILASPLLQTWIEEFPSLRANQSPIPLLFDELSKLYTEPMLAEQLLVAQNNKDAKETATLLADHQMDVWLKQKYSGDDVFKRLGLKEAGILVFESPLWDTWISYMVKKANSEKSQAKNGNKAISKTKLALQVLMTHYDDDVLRNWFSTAKSEIGNKRAGYIERSFNQILKEGEAPVTRKRQQNEGKAPAP